VNILLIEDDPIFSTLVSNILSRSLNVTVTMARSAEEAFRSMKQDTPPDFIFVDLGLPDSPSMKTAQLIPKIAELNPHSPICVLSGTSDDKLMKMSTSLGADFFQSKQEMRSQVDLWAAIKKTYENRIARGIPPEEVGEQLVKKIDELLFKTSQINPEP
jgi:DNA-binding NarL/FixJ family response regulator